jgi:hypothetical protein
MRAVDTALARIEAVLEMAADELSVFSDDAPEDTDRAVTNAREAPVLIVSDARPPARSVEARGSSASSALDGGSSENTGDSRFHSRRVRPETTAATTIESMRVSLRRVVAAAEDETRGGGTNAEASRRVESSIAALAVATRAAADAVGAAAALAFLESAVAHDPVVSPLVSSASRASRMTTTHVEDTLADALASVSLDLASAEIDRVGRKRAAALALAPVETHLASPPPAALGRFPQLRALLKAESAFARDPSAASALRALPFVTERGGTRRLAARSDEPIPAFLEERGHWGARVAFRDARCPRCAVSFRASAGDEPSQAETLVTFPCGHTFHACCVPEDACVECLRTLGAAAGREPGREAEAAEPEFAAETREGGF